MRLVGALTLGLALVATAVRGDELRAVHVLSRDGEAVREHKLVTALRIYMRDLSRTVTTGGAAPQRLTPVEVDRLVADGVARGAEVVVWFGGSRSVPVLFALRPGVRDLRETAVDLEDLGGACRALALKVRTLVQPPREPVVAVPTVSGPVEAPPTPPPERANEFEWVRVELPPSAAPEVVVEVTPPPPAVAVEVVSPPPVLVETAPPATPPEAPVEVPAEPPPPPPPPSPEPAPVVAEPPRVEVPPSVLERLSLEVSFSVAASNGGALVRAGAGLRASTKLADAPIVLGFEAFPGPAMSYSAGAATVTARDVPVGVVALACRVSGRLRLGVGGTLRLHVIDGTAAAADGRSESARLYSGGVGAIGEARWEVSGPLAIVLGLGAEVMVPDRVLNVAGATVADFGFVQVGASAGLALVAW